METGKVYVADLNHHVQVLNPDLTFSKSFGKEGHGKGQFTYLYGVTCDSTGLVYVASDTRVQVFTSEGKFLRTSTAGLNHPGGIAVDSNGIVYVSEGAHIFTFSPEGVKLSHYGKGNNFAGLAVDSYGVVYVCDLYNDCIQLF